METYLDKITNHLYAFLLWDDSWNAFNNSYLLVERNEIILIDSGKAEHFHFLEQALKSIGINKGEISKYLLTHGHKDHIGGISFLNHLKGFIHHNDIELVPDEMKERFNSDLSGGNMEYILLRHHTKGSVAYYDKQHMALFCGDHISFFGEKLNENQVVDEGNKVREKFKQFVYDWSQKEEMRKQYDFESFIIGLKKMQQFDIEYLCTGHGVVLKGNINSYLDELITIES
ncbi:MBL fold metallo-hydrolase [Robertmurraya massiliosenegalensis]|uniref:MBL fold metallo-hydrolase n=1 Tax=Robertmurraya massiliosenegalensis TaxID=1287657 RepID=UPI0002F604C1|nr:MBL fold metallo-hydrolase [Robertmurraya massiliosenegalensis]